MIGHNEISLIVNAINNEISKRFNLDAQLFQVISLLNLNIAGYLNSELRKFKFSYIFDILYGYYFYIIFSILCYYLYKNKIQMKIYYYNYYNYKSKLQQLNNNILKEEVNEESNDIKEKRSFYTIDISNIPNAIISINRYIQLHPEFYNTNICYKLINYQDDGFYPIYDEQLKFNDTIHDVYGYIITHYNETIEDKIVKKNYTMKISLHKKEKDKSSYIDNIERYVTKQIKYGNQVSLNYYKILSTNLVVYNFYNEDLAKWKKDIKFIEDGFFSPHKEYLFSIMKQKMEYSIKNNNWNNLLLHGGPGLGKSSFIYRVATLLKKNIISIDLNLYIDKKKELYAIFHGQEFSLPNVDTKQTTNKNCIIILEEFDNCIKKLVDLEQIHEFKSFTIKHSFDQKKKQILKDQKELETLKKDKNRDSIIKNVRSNRDVSNRLSMVNLDIDTAIKSINNNTKSDILRLSDLLELFQGPIPIKDRLIIATTNYFKEIKNIIPALFRPGRLTPIHFTYLDWNSFNDLCNYYYGQTMECKPFKINLSTSHLMEIAIKHSIVKKDFNKFTKEIIKLNDQKRFDLDNHWSSNLEEKTEGKVEEEVEEEIEEEVEEEIEEEVEEKINEEVEEKIKYEEIKEEIKYEEDIKKDNAYMNKLLNMKYEVTEIEDEKDSLDTKLILINIYQQNEDIQK